jgi:hypothetical protein
VYQSCTQQEAAATGVTLISFNGDLFEFNIVSSVNKSRRDGRTVAAKPISEYSVADYRRNSTWSVAYQPVGDVPGVLEAISSIQKFQDYQKFFEMTENLNSVPVCVEGGENHENSCNGGSADLSDAWLTSMREFWKTPSDDWFALLKRIHAKLSRAQPRPATSSKRRHY